MVLKNGLIALSGENTLRRFDIQVDKGIISGIGNNLVDENIVDCKGLWIFPGAIDPHVHFYDPGYTDKEDFYSGTAFAASGGITCIIDMPCTSNPPVTNAANLQTKLNIVEKKACIDFAFFGGVSRQLFDEPADAASNRGYKAAMKSIADKVMGFKTYAVSGMDNVWGALDYYRMSEVMKYAVRLNTVVLLHAEDRSYVDNATAHYSKTGNSPDEWYQSRPEIAEVLSAQSASSLAEEYGGNLHIVHIGSQAVTKYTGKNSAEYKVTGETCPQYLAFDVEDFKRMGAVLKIAPPIKQNYNHEGLWNALKSGALSFISSDHAPGTVEEKTGNDIWKNSAGICGTGTLLPYLLSEGYLKTRLSLSRFLEVMCENAAKRYGFFNRKGSIEKGKDADFVLVDPDSQWTVDQNLFLSKGRLSPFNGASFKGRVSQTFVRGMCVYDAKQGIIVEPGHGRFITPERGK